MAKNTFVFNLDWAEALAEQPDDIRLAVYEAIVHYARTGKVPNMQPIAKLAFSFIKKQIDRNSENYEAMIQARREAGKKGAKVSNEQQKSAKPADNDNDNDNDNVNDNDNDIKENNVKEKSQSFRFAPPTPSEVKEYMEKYVAQKRAEGKFLFPSPDLPERFCNFYESKGWKVGSNAMKDWRAAARNWISDSRSKQKNVNSTIHFEGEYDRSVYARDAELVKQLQKQ